MGKFIKWLFIIIIVILLIGFFAWSFVPGMISKDLTKKMGVPVTIGSMGITPWSLTVGNFVIGNPPGSVLPKALTIKSIDVKAPITRYLDDKIVIDYVGLNNIYLGLEFDKPLAKQGNWTTIMNNMKRNSQKTGSKNEKPVLIKRLVITNMDIEMAFRDNPQQKPRFLKGIKRMEFTNVSSKGGLPIDEITSQIIGEMLQEVFSREGLQNMIDGILSPGEILPFGGGLFGADLSDDAA